MRLLACALLIAAPVTILTAPPAAAQNEAAATLLVGAKVGDELKPLVLPPVSRHQLALYCGGSGDHNPIHVDLDFAKKFGFKDVFAHGMLSMAFLGRLVTSYAPNNKVRKLGTRFTSITWVGDVITVLLNESTLRKWGFKVGSIQLVIVKNE